MIGWASFQPVGNESRYLLDALESGWVSHGPYIDKLEDRASELLGGGTALAVANGTAALMLALQTLDLKIGDRVVVPAFSFQAAANVLLQLGAEPVFCDVDPLNWNQTKANVEAVLDDTIKGVIVVHNYGSAADIGPIAELCRLWGIWLVEDAAEAWFTKYTDQYVGQFGDIATFSMHATKTIACGEGGIVLVNRADLASKARLHRSHGLNRAQVQYKHLIAGNNYRLSNLLAAVAFAQIEEYEAILDNQRRRSKLFRQLLENVPGLTFQRSLNDATDEFWADAVLLDSAVTSIERDNLLERISEAGADMRPGFYPPSSLEYYDDTAVNSTPVADHIASNLFVLPCAQGITNKEIVEVSKMVQSYTSQKMTANAKYSVQELVPTDPRDMEQLKTFIDGLPKRDYGFRYFDKRDLGVLKNHLCTLLLFCGDFPVGYGHLDNEDNTVWLGIALNPEFLGKKLGHTIMHKLMQYAADSQVGRVNLFVDRDNVAAQKLYLRHGFEIDKRKSTTTAIRMFKQN